MKRAFQIIQMLAFLVFSTPAFAQPLFHSEHDWSINLASTTFGIERIVQEPGHWQQSRIQFADFVFEPERILEDRVVFLVPAVSEIYTTHTITRFIVEQWDSGKWKISVSRDRLIVLCRRLALPYFVASPRLYDYPNPG
jgi:hypothetical protein